MARGEIKKLSSLFDKYKLRLVAPEASVINAFIEVVRDLLGIELAKGKIRYSPTSKTLSTTLAGPLRSEIKLREGEIIAHLKGRLGEKNAPKTIL